MIGYKFLRLLYQSRKVIIYPSGGDSLASAIVHKDLANIKRKVLFGLTGRQIICFGTAVLVGVPLFFLLRDTVSSSTAALCMIFAMFPFFMFAMYERNGQPLEVFLRHMIQTVFVRPKVRVYRTRNLYTEEKRLDDLRKEVRRILAEE